MQIPTSSGSVLRIDLSFFYFYQPIASDACVFVYVYGRVHVCNKIPIIHRPLYAPWSLIDGMPEIIYACYYYIYVYVLHDRSGAERPRGWSYRDEKLPQRNARVQVWHQRQGAHGHQRKVQPG